MVKTIRVRRIGAKETREVSLEEAREILEKTFSDPVAGMVADARTGELIWEIGPDTEEILIIEQMIGGG